MSSRVSPTERIRADIDALFTGDRDLQGVTKTNALESRVIAGFVRGLSVRDVEAHSPTRWVPRGVEHIDGLSGGARRSRPSSTPRLSVGSTTRRSTYSCGEPCRPRAVVNAAATATCSLAGLRT